MRINSIITICGLFVVGSELQGKSVMMKRHIYYILCPLLVIGLFWGLSSVAHASANSNIHPNAKWAWSTNAGWINFNPPDGGVMVCPDHLEGYAWGENVGWIRLGTHTGCDVYTYSNLSADDYGVNWDASGALSGFAWGTNVGWINFNPESDQGVMIDPVTGDFSGYAWGENTGWINFNSSGPVAYRVSMLAYRYFLPLMMGR
jgi:hypothetical protein